MKFHYKHVLVVDDNPVNIELMLDLLDDQGFENSHGISDPRDVLGYCQQQLPDLLLLDIRMPHLDGYAVIEQLNHAFGRQTPPIIVLTAQIDNDTKQRSLALGVRDFITKPFQHAEVLQRIHNVLSVEHRFRIRDQQADSLERMVNKRTRELNRQSRTDPITQLPNRRGLSQTLSEAAALRRPTGLLFIALDRLDDVIRLHGYRIAERLLGHIAQRLDECLSDAETLGLWGGSELLVISERNDDDELLALAHQLMAVFEHDQQLDDLLLPLAARIGISRSQGAFDTERLVHMAALALPAPQSFAVQCYSENLEAQQRHRLHVQQALRGATERGEMSLAFQPKLSLMDQRIVGAEALLRWHHPELGQISPGMFIPLAEASGDIFAIGEWVMEEAMRTITQWREQQVLGNNFHVAVNVAARQLARRDFADGLLRQLAARQIPTHFFAIEVTESGLMGDMQNARQQLARLSQANIAVAIDDFGTGHSSLAYIKTLPFSTLKIDRAFVMDLEESDVDRQLARTITQLAHSVGCDVVAEGIETWAQAQYLRRIGCEIAQGYYYSRPLPADDFIDWCDHWQSHLPPTATETV
ncbi:putative bifunctional diguanylate cyclase/phosphodiesterase [Halomonas sp. HL-93]|uniref:putative bifunctional diguanylate cyclase/phosphodiesterase n=1 Tax=Halomonas sp. HL-93 TaxID=1666906 RepID=UPI0006DA08DE|nr:EAL domain-containing protein [Halomonas sp. HL-93]KPQ21376.1 MAG: diguanylate cyclase (GGDEF) domain [Halomonas sp. HL-93]SBR46733.1 diguanylate cyclase (GGDEF) domain-containing protein [Halomonas sp. HL-93]